MLKTIGSNCYNKD